MSEETAAGLASLLFIGITAGRLLSGFLTSRFSDTALTRIGCATVAVSVVILLLPLGITGASAGLLLLGLGCAPVYPCVIHATPGRFGQERSQAVIGLQMACAYIGTTLVPPFFGVLARATTFAIFPFFILAILILLVLSHERLHRLMDGPHS